MGLQIALFYSLKSLLFVMASLTVGEGDFSAARVAMPALWALKGHRLSCQLLYQLASGEPVSASSEQPLAPALGLFVHAQPCDVRLGQMQQQS